MSVADFGAKGDGSDETAMIQAALDALKVRGGRLRFPAGEYHHTGLRLSGASNVVIEGEGATLVYTGDMDRDGVVISTDQDQDARGLIVRNLGFRNGWTALKVIGDGAGVFSDVTVDGCSFDTSKSGMLWLTHVRGARILNNHLTKGGDNAIYAAFSSEVLISGNHVVDSAGSGGIVAGYSDDTVRARSIVISENTVEVSATATATHPVSGQRYISGIDVVFASGATIANNVVRNASTTGGGVVTGIVVEEWFLDQVLVIGNTVVAPRERAIRIGTASNSVVSDVTITGNHLYGGQLDGAGGSLDGIQIDRADRVLVQGNDVEGFGQNGVRAGATASRVRIVGNTFKDVGVQVDYGTYRGVWSAAPETEVLGNTFSVGEVGGVVTTTARGASIWISSAQPKLDVVEQYVSVMTVDTTGMTWAQVKNAIERRAGWSMALYPGSANRSASLIRRSGDRGSTAVGASYPPIFLGVPEPYELVHLSARGGRVIGNRIVHGSSWSPPNPFHEGVLYAVPADTEMDSNPHGVPSGGSCTPSP